MLGMRVAILFSSTDRRLKIIRSNNFFMKNLTRSAICSLSILLGLLIIISCKKLERVTMVVTGDVTVQITSAIASAEIIDIGDGIIQHGHCWGTTPDVDVNGEKTSLGIVSNPLIYSSELTNLTASTTYYIKAYSTSGKTTIYGKERTFNTNDAGVPVITTSNVTGIASTTATGGGSITSNQGALIMDSGVCWGNTANPTITDSKTSENVKTGSFFSEMTGLSPGGTYHVRAYATNSVGTGYGDDKTFVTTTQVYDIDGNTYGTVVIGTQTWMAENLKVTRFNDGTPIPYITDNAEWSATKSSSFCWYNNDIAYKSKTGAIYSGYVFYSSGKNVCPVNWHVPTDEEWTILTLYLGGEDVAGGKLKKTGTTLWRSPNDYATNESGFSALPGGERNPDASFDRFGASGYYWSSTPGTTANSLSYKYFDYRYPTIANWSIHVGLGYSIRCIKD